MSKKKVKSTCPDCGNKSTAIYDSDSWINQHKCNKCYKIYWITKSGEADNPVSPSYHKYKDATAIGYDKKTGQQVALDTKGKRIPLSETRYNNIRNDPYGWKATGKKVRE